MKYSIFKHDDTDQCVNDLDRVIALAKITWSETLRKVHGDYPVNHQSFVAEWRDGNIIIVVARNEAGRIDGYQLWNIGSTWMTPHITSATMIAVYLAEEYRGKGDFVPFVSFGMMAMDAHGSKHNFILTDANSSMFSYFTKHGWSPRSVLLEVKNV